MAGFNTTTPEMDTAARRVADVNQSVQALLSGLRSEVSGVGGHWRGQSAAAFTQLMASYDAEAKKLNDVLAAIGEQLGAASRGYAASDDAGTRTLRGAGSGLTL